ncbi:MAG: hypothetical protein ACREBR_00070 [bacterium]
MLASLERSQQEETPEDEITKYEDMRTIGAIEGCWRFFASPLHQRWPSCISLQIHLAGHQNVLFHDDDDMNHIVDHLPRMTHLTAFYLYNDEHRADEDNLQLRFIDFPT